MSQYLSSVGGVSGLSSGVNWRELIDSLLALERRPVTLVQQRQRTLSERTAALAQVRASLAELSARAYQLALRSSFHARRVEVSGGALSATAGSDAVPGIYRVAVLSLATPTTALSVRPAGRAVDASVPLSQALPAAPASGYFTLNGARIYLDENTTLSSGENSVVARVNGSGTGVRAVLLRDAAGRLNHLALYATGGSLVAGSASDTSDFLRLAGLHGAQAASAWVGGAAEGSAEGKAAGDLSEDVTVAFTYAGVSYSTAPGEIGPATAGETSLEELAARLEAAMNRALGGGGRLSVAVDDPSGAGNARLVVVDRAGGGQVEVASLSGTQTAGLESLLSSGGAAAGLAAAGQIPLGRISTGSALYLARLEAPLMDGWLSGFLSAQGDRAGFDLEGTETVTFEYRGATYQTEALQAAQSGITDLTAVAADLEAKMNAALGDAGSVRVSLLRDEAGRVRLAVTDLSAEEPPEPRAVRFTAGPEALRLTATQGGESKGAVSVNSKVVYYDKYADTISAFLSRLNAAGAGVRAHYDPLSDRVVLTSTSTGAVSLDLADHGGSLLEALGLTGPGAQRTGSPASLVVEGYNDGLPVYSDSNTVTGIIPGLTLRLQGPSELDPSGKPVPVEVRVEADAEAVVKLVRDFLDAYNRAIQTLSDHLKYDPQSKKAGALSGVSQARDLLGRLRGLTSLLPLGLEGSPLTLGDIGISTGRVGSSAEAARAGQLSLDEERFKAALLENPERVYRILGAWTGEVALQGGGTGSIASASGRPEGESRAGTYRIVSDAQGNLTAYFTPAGGEEELVGTGTISAWGTNEDLIPGVTLRAGELREGEDILIKEASTTGVLRRLKSYLDEVNSSGGTLYNLTSALESISRDLAYQVERMEERLKEREARLIARFTAMETALSRMQAQSQWLTNQILTLNRNWRGGGSA